MVKRFLGAALILLCGCNGIAGIHEGILDPCADAGECDAASGAGGAGGGLAGADTTSSGAGSGLCGNGVIDVGEECDDANEILNDGCSGCVMDCAGPGAFKDAVSHHCYRFNGAKLDFTQATFVCQMLNSTLAVITSPEELDLVSPHLQGDTWIGGSELAMTGIYTWADGETWDYAPWKPGEPDGAFLNQACIKLAGPPPAGFADDDCTHKLPFLCERSPTGQAPP